MSKKVTVVLAVLVVALVAYIAFFEQGSLSSKELEARKGKVLESFVREKVTQLTLTHGKQKLVLSRVKEGDSWSEWKMVQPSKVEADQDSVDKLLGELEWLSARRLLQNVSAADLKTFGLTSPAYRVDYRVSDDDHTLLLGAADVHGQSYYAQVDGAQDVFVVPQTLVEALDHDVGHFRDKRLLGSITSAWARKLELSNGAGKVSLEKQNGRWWVLAAPKSYADSKRLGQLLERLDALRAVRFLQGNEREAGLKALASASTVDLRVVPDEHREDKEAQRFLLRFAGECAGHRGERYAQSGEQGDPVCVSADDLTLFDDRPDALRLWGLLDADPSEVEKLELVSGTSKLLLKRDGEKWLREGEGTQPDREAVEAWLADLKAQRASSFGPAHELSSQHSLTFWLSSETKHVVRLSADRGMVLVRRDDEPALLTFAGPLSDRLAYFEGRFGALEPWSAQQPSQVQGIEARHGALSRKLSLKDGSWQNEKGAPLDVGQVRERVRELLKLHVLSIVSNAVRPEYGLDKPLAELRFGLKEGGPLVLALGASSGRGLFARLGDGRVVEVESSVGDAVLELAGVTPAKRVVAGPEGEEGPRDEHEEHEH